ncbi:MAG: DUF4836 family protein [Prevotella sp.]
MRSNIISLLLISAILSFTSCTDDYVNVIPGNSTAIVAVDCSAITKGNRFKEALQRLLETDDLSRSGIDLTDRIYLFETADGSLGLAAKVSDDEELHDMLSRLAQKGNATKPKKKKNKWFSVVKDKWVLGYTSDVLVVMGPSLPVQHTVMMRRTSRLLEQNKEKSIKTSPLFERLSALQGSVTMVARASSLSDKLQSLFVMGAPEGTDPSQIIVEASVGADIADGYINVGISTSSPNEQINSCLEKSSGKFRPLNGVFCSSMSADAALGLFVNVDGHDFIDLLHKDPTFQTLLTGMNMAVDMDKILGCMNGEIAVMLPRMMTSFSTEEPVSDSQVSLSIAGELKDKTFLADVPYWKKSCPQGSSITDCGRDFYCYEGNGFKYYFGVTPDMKYYSGSTQSEARQSVAASARPLSREVLSFIKGHRFCVVANISAITSSFASDLTPSLSGDVKYIVITDNGQ